MDDWKFLCDRVKVREDSRYLHHQAKPVVLLWGLGFKDRPWTPEQGAELVEFFKNDPKYGGVYLIGGIDPFWRTLRGESRQDAGWAEVYRSFDAISPWDAGRYRDDASMDRIRNQVWEGDLAELKASGKGYMPTAFPGFSWDNMRRMPPGSRPVSGSSKMITRGWWSRPQAMVSFCFMPRDSSPGRDCRLSDISSSPRIGAARSRQSVTL